MGLIRNGWGELGSWKETDHFVLSNNTQVLSEH